MRHSAKVSNCVAINKFLSDCTLGTAARLPVLWQPRRMLLNGLTLSLCVGALRFRAVLAISGQVLSADGNMAEQQICQQTPAPERMAER